MHQPDAENSQDNFSQISENSTTILRPEDINFQASYEQWFKDERFEKSTLKFSQENPAK